MEDIQKFCEMLQSEISEKVSWSRFIWIVGSLAAISMLGLQGLNILLSSDIGSNSERIEINREAIRLLESKMVAVDRIDERTINMQEDLKELKLIIKK